MKIAIVGLLHHPIAEPFAGGMESHTWWLAKTLIDRGHDVTLFASGDSDPGLGLSPCIEKSFATNPATQTVEHRRIFNTIAYTQVMQKLCQGGFDVVHNNALHPFLLLNAADLPIPMLMVLHVPPYKELAAAVRYAVARNTQDQLKVVSVSNSLADNWRSLVPSTVIHNGIDTSSWTIPGNRPEKTALWYGRFVPEKAPHLAIKAALIAGFRLLLAGPIGNQEYFQTEIEPLLNRPEINYLGHLPQAAIKRAFSQAQVMLHTPLWEEPFGLVYTESLASGTPVATFDSGAASEILTAECGAIATEKTPQALAAAIRKAAQLSSQACRQRAKTRFSVDVMVEGYERIYRQLANNQRAKTQKRLARMPAAMTTQALIGITG